MKVSDDSIHTINNSMDTINSINTSIERLRSLAIQKVSFCQKKVYLNNSIVARVGHSNRVIAILTVSYSYSLTNRLWSEKVIRLIVG